MTTVLILGSGPGVIAARDWPRAPFETIVAINNAWSVRPDWDVHIHPEDFPPDRRPPAPSPGQRIVGAADYVPVQNAFGGFVWAGGTMAFTAGYWALGALRPRVLAFLGCDMVYPETGPTHFYGTGTADPLRQDVTLRSLEAKATRLMALAARHGCACVSLGTGASRLTFPRATPATLAAVAPRHFDPDAVAALEAEEARLGYFVASGRYWTERARFDPAEIDRIDAGWRALGPVGPRA